MERKDVMAKNVGIFNAQGAALAAYAKPTVRCVVVGNPANTNAAILARAAPSVPWPIASSPCARRSRRVAVSNIHAH